MICKLLFVLGLLISPAVAHAQKVCSKGVACGDSCISATKTCHIATPAKTTSVTTVTTEGDWVASARGHTYYRSGCAGAKKLNVSNLVHFKTEADAKKAGLKRSAQKGC